MSEAYTAKRVGRGKRPYRFELPYESRDAEPSELGRAVKTALESKGLESEAMLFRGTVTEDLKSLIKHGTDRISGSYEGEPDQPETEALLKSAGILPGSWAWLSTPGSLESNINTQNPIFYARPNEEFETSPVVLVYDKSMVEPIGDVVDRLPATDRTRLTEELGLQGGNTYMFSWKETPKAALRAIFTWRGEPAEPKGARMPRVTSREEGQAVLAKYAHLLKGN